MSWEKPVTNLMVFDKEKLQEKLELNKRFIVPETGMKFMDEHYGLRPGCIHTLMGSTGSGKSTLMQSLLFQWGKKMEVLCYLTEESEERFESKIFEKNQNSEYLSPNVFLMHEKEIVRQYSSHNYKAMLQEIEKGIIESKAKIVVIDNLTTSAFYDGNFSACIPIISGLRGLAERYKVAMFVVVHTKKGVSEMSKGLMSPDDVRGSANISNTSDYFYTFYRVGMTTGTGMKIWGNFLFVNKCRDHDTQGNIYRLNYDFERKLYHSDSQVSFDTFKKFMKDKDRL